jgi:hypothetical protein
MARTRTLRATRSPQASAQPHYIPPPATVADARAASGARHVAAVTSRRNPRAVASAARDGLSAELRPAPCSQPAPWLCSVRPQLHAARGSSCTAQSGSCCPSRWQASHSHTTPFKISRSLTVRCARFWGKVVALCMRRLKHLACQWPSTHQHCAAAARWRHCVLRVLRANEAVSRGSQRKGAACLSPSSSIGAL